MLTVPKRESKITLTRIKRVAMLGYCEGIQIFNQNLLGRWNTVNEKVA